jgi:hypothetical protein
LLWPYALPSTAGLIAHVARNADDASFNELLDLCQSSPLVVGVCVAAELLRLARQLEATSREQAAAAVVTTRLADADWSDHAVWTELEVYGRDVLGIAAALTSNEHVAARLEQAIGENPDVVASLIRGSAAWIESYGTRDDRLLGWSRRYGELPPWLPRAAVLDGIGRLHPGLAPAEEPRTDDEAERLAAQILFSAG